MNKEEILAARVPRYTSYPTAPHFTAAVNSEVYRGWLEALEPAAPLSLYLHIPFCDTLCWFCGCHTKVINHYAPLSSYLDVLLREIDMVASILGTRRRVTHIHWGGGSPTMLNAADMRRLVGVLHGAFDIAPDAEFAVEIDPRGFTADHAETLAGIGVNRASVGVQDFDPKVQQAINRIQDFETTANCVRLLREAGISRLSIDLIYGLPYQSVAGLRHTIDCVFALDPDRLAVFGYAHVPGFKKHQKLIAEHALPDLHERLAQADAVRERLVAAGYESVGLDHFAKADDAMAVAGREGRLVRNFQGYTTDTAPALIGFGASAIGSLPQGYVQNFTEVPAWRAAVLTGELPAWRGIALSKDDRIRRDVIARLMCELQVDLVQIARKYGRTARMFAGDLARLQPLVKDGLVTVEGGVVRVPEDWRNAVRIVAAAFDTYLNKAGTHSVAI